MNKALGGFIEFGINESDNFIHQEALAVNSGRSGLYIILKNLGVKKIWVSRYNCDAILEPISALGIDYGTYDLESNLLPKSIKLKEGEVILYVDYYGLNRTNCLEVLKKYGKENVILDLSQAFFNKYASSIYSFYSPRKFFGLPDGGLVYPNSKETLPQNKTAKSLSHLFYRLEGDMEKAYQAYLDNEKSLSFTSAKAMSLISQKILRGQNMEEIKRIRNINFKLYHDNLSFMNEFDFLDLKDLPNDSAPLGYPLLIRNGYKLREALIEQKVFIPKYWPNEELKVKENSVEENLVNNLLLLPIDQRNSPEDIESIITLINKYEN